jgi:hypothetical protein
VSRTEVRRFAGKTRPSTCSVKRIEERSASKGRPYTTEARAPTRKVGKACSVVGRAIPFPGDLGGFLRENSWQVIEDKYG